MADGSRHRDECHLGICTADLYRTQCSADSPQLAAFNTHTHGLHHIAGLFCCSCSFPGLPTTADTAAVLGPDTVQRIVDTLGARKTAGLAQKLGGDDTGQLVTDMGPGVTSDVVQGFGPDLTAQIVEVGLLGDDCCAHMLCGVGVSVSLKTGPLLPRFGIESYQSTATDL